MRLARNTTPGCAPRDRQRVRIHHAFGLGVAADLAAVLRLLGEGEQVRVAVVPGLAAVEAAHHAADLQRHVDFVRVLRRHRNAQHAGREVHLHDAAGGGDLQFGKALAAVFAAVDGRHFRADQQHVRVLRVDQDRPDHLVLAGQGQVPPRGAGIVAAPDAVAAAEIDDVRRTLLDGDGADLDVGRQAARHLLPLAGCGIEPIGALHLRSRSGRRRAGRADIDVLGHEVLPVFVVGAMLADGRRMGNAPVIPGRVEVRREARRPSRMAPRNDG